MKHLDIEGISRVGPNYQDLLDTTVRFYIKKNNEWKELHSALDIDATELPDHKNLAKRKLR